MDKTHFSRFQGHGAASWWCGWCLALAFGGGANRYLRMGRNKTEEQVVRARTAAHFVICQNASSWTELALVGSCVVGPLVVGPSVDGFVVGCSVGLSVTGLRVG